MLHLIAESPFPCNSVPFPTKLNLTFTQLNLTLFSSNHFPIIPVIPFFFLSFTVESHEMEGEGRATCLDSSLKPL